MRVIALVLGLCSLSGCMRAYTVTMGPQPPETAHYVLVQTRGSGRMFVYDCLSKPDGEHWNPTCVRADMRSEAGRTDNTSE